MGEDAEDERPKDSLASRPVRVSFDLGPRRLDQAVVLHA
jgi:hypothetical protein